MKIRKALRSTIGRRKKQIEHRFRFNGERKISRHLSAARYRRAALDFHEEA